MITIDIYNKIQDRADTYPWFIKRYQNRIVITDRDLIKVLGIDFDLKELNNKDIIFRKDWNALGQGKSREEFEIDNNVHYEDETFFFVYLSGFFKILKLLFDENKLSLSQIENILIQFT